jgi:triacylglycerol lipase
MRNLVTSLLLSLIAACSMNPTSSTSSASSKSLASQVPPAIEASLRQMGRVIEPMGTARLYAPLHPREPYAGVKVARSLAYGPNTRHLLDVFTPTAGVAPRTVLVFVHGGGFVSGDRRMGDSPFYDNVMLWAAEQGMVGVNITYRLAPQDTWPAAQRDLAAALRWVRQNIGTYGGDASRIVLMGHSAGATHIAQYLGHPQFHVAPHGGVVGAILVSPLPLFDMNMSDPSVLKVIQNYFGHDASRYAEQSPMPGLGTLDVPLLLAFAELDPEDFQRQVLKAHEALCQAGRCPSLLELRGHTHLSEIQAVHTADHALSDAAAEFIATLR